MQTQPNTKEIKEKDKDLLDFIKFPEDVFHSKEYFKQDTLDSTNKGVIVDGVRLPM